VIEGLFYEARNPLAAVVIGASHDAPDEIAGFRRNASDRVDTQPDSP
jgi:hypothetical protein